jgi:hypothetical protein
MFCTYVVTMIVVGVNILGVHDKLKIQTNIWHAKILCKHKFKIKFKVYFKFKS